MMHSALIWQACLLEVYPHSESKAVWRERAGCGVSQTPATLLTPPAYHTLLPPSPSLDQPAKLFFTMLGTGV